MTDNVAAIIAQLSQAQVNAIVASAVFVPTYRDRGLMLASLVKLRLAAQTPRGAVLTKLGKLVRIELKDRRK